MSTSASRRFPGDGRRFIAFAAGTVSAATAVLGRTQQGYVREPRERARVGALPRPNRAPPRALPEQEGRAGGPGLVPRASGPDEPGVQRGPTCASRGPRTAREDCSVSSPMMTAPSAPPLAVAMRGADKDVIERIEQEALAVSPLRSSPGFGGAAFVSSKSRAGGRGRRDAHPAENAERPGP